MKSPQSFISAEEWLRRLAITTSGAPTKFLTVLPATKGALIADWLIIVLVSVVAAFSAATGDYIFFAIALSFVASSFANTLRDYMPNLFNLGSLRLTGENNRNAAWQGALAAATIVGGVTAIVFDEELWAWFIVGPCAVFITAVAVLWLYQLSVGYRAVKNISHAEVESPKAAELLRSSGSVDSPILDLHATEVLLLGSANRASVFKRDYVDLGFERQEGIRFFVNSSQGRLSFNSAYGIIE